MTTQVRWRAPFADFDLQFQSMSEEIMATIRATLEQGDLIMRAPVLEFEASFARFLGVKHAIGVSNGTDALRLALEAAGIGPGDEVITVAHTFVATVATIVQAGATPVLVDVGEDFNLDLALAEAAVTPRTRAIVPVHLNGRMCDMDWVMALAQRHNLVVVEDTAQALGARFKEQIAGTIGQIGCFSFFPGKVMGALGDAGAVTTNDDEIARKLRLLRDHGRDGRVELRCFGYNCRLDSLQAAVLSLKLKRVPQWIAHRRRLAALYQDGLRDIAALKLPKEPADDPGFFDVYQSYVIEAPDRDQLAAYLHEQGVEALVYWPKPLHHMEPLGLTHFRLPRTESLGNTVLSLPLHANLTIEQAEYVVESLRAYYATKEGSVA